MTEAFCVRCRKKVRIKKEKIVTLRNGKQAKIGVCEVCGTKVSKIIKKKDPITILLSRIFNI